MADNSFKPPDSIPAPNSCLASRGQSRPASCQSTRTGNVEETSDEHTFSFSDWPGLPSLPISASSRNSTITQRSASLWSNFGSSHRQSKSEVVAEIQPGLPSHHRSAVTSLAPYSSSQTNEASSTQAIFPQQVSSPYLVSKNLLSSCWTRLSPHGATESVELHETVLPFLFEITAFPHIKLPPDASDNQNTKRANVVEEPFPVEEPRDMATLGTNSSGDARRAVVSPRPKGRENAKNTICRNIGIYGHCRWEKEGCAFNHDVGSSKNSQSQGSDNSKKLNVESPAFQPLQPASNGSRSTAISPKAAGAAPFTPKTNSATPQLATMQPGLAQSNWASTQNFQEFVPQTDYSNQLLQQTDTNAAATNILGFADPYALSSNVQGLTGTHTTTPLNPYAQDTSALTSAAYFQTANTFVQPAQYHHYAPMGPHRENLLAYQRTAHDFFMPEKLREDLQKKAEATLHVLPTSTLPNIENFHSLVPLDTSGQRSSATFGYVSWLYKAQSSKDGKYYALRRLEGFRLTNEKAIQAARSWKPVDNGGIVNIYEAFTTREFGDSSLIVVTDYHPNSKTLAETHLQGNNRYGHGRHTSPHVPENVLWSYIVQLASAIKAVHSTRLAVRAILPHKVIVTSKNRIRLNGCGILDVVQFDNQYPLHDLQQEDFVQLGRLILSIAGNANAALNMNKAIEHLSRTYQPKLKDCVMWLLNPSDPAAGEAGAKNIDTFLQGISTEMCQTLDMTFHEADTLTSTLSSELENGRLVRLMAKLGLINERPETEHNLAWSETGERYYLKLFRDYVFHAVDENGRPVTDLGHIISCLNKLDAGSEERIMLTSRDEQSVFVVSYREVKKGIEAAFGELTRGGGNGGGRRV